jgi:hypothetical protein
MQYLDGESLDTLLEKRRQLDVAEAAPGGISARTIAGFLYEPA